MSLWEVRYVPGVAAVGQVRHIRPGLDVHLVRLLAVARHDVAQVPLAAVRARDVPSAPSFLEGTAVVGPKRARAEMRQAAGRTEDRPHQQAGHVAGVGRGVAAEAVAAIADELGLVLRLLCQRVEDCALLRIDRGHFQDLAALHPADVDVVVEVQAPRRLGRNALTLEAGLREHQHLRGGRDRQLLQHRLQVAVPRDRIPASPGPRPVTAGAGRPGPPRRPSGS